MPQAVKVGIFMTLCLVVLAYLILKIEDLTLFGEEGQQIDAVFDSVVGLDDRAPVRQAGVRVGRVEGIRLDGRRARVTLVLDSDLVVTEGARAAIANMGLLGDTYIQLIPGPVGAPPLPEGTVLEGSTPPTIDEVMAKLEDLGGTFQEFAGALTGDEGGGLAELIASAQRTSEEIGAVVAENRAAFAGTVRNFESFSGRLAEELPRLTSQIERVLAQVETVLDENRGNLRESMANIKELSARVQVSVDNLNEISGKIARGEGTLGKLVNSDEAHNELVSALGSVEQGVGALTDTLGRVRKVKLNLGLEGAYLESLEDSRGAFHLDILPAGEESTRFYRLELVRDPRGRITEKTDTTTVTLPDGTVETTVTERFTRETARNLFSALFGFPFAEEGRLWAGMVESSFGVEVDYALFDRRLLLSFEAFDFGRERDLDPHLRLTGRWRLLPNLYLSGGYDDLLVNEYDSFFLGAGIRWSDEDLKYLLGSIPNVR